MHKRLKHVFHEEAMGATHLQVDVLIYDACQLEHARAAAQELHEQAVCV